jgi:hypothetical protein
MAYTDPTGNVQPEQGDILPREVAHRSDDPAKVTELIDKLNPTIKTAEDLAAAVEQVDALRRSLADETNVDNPHIEAGDTDSTPEPKELGRKNIKGAAEK